MNPAQDAELVYRRAFEEFSKKVQQVQSLTKHPNTDRGLLETALVELETARVHYNESRDAWVQHLLPSSTRKDFPTVRRDSPQAYAEHVRSIAKVLWESAGRPDGTADEDWRRAEEIVHRAANAA
jgi:hypothetical protein